MTETASLPTTQKALKVHGPGDLRLQHDCLVPILQDDEILVRVRCVAINPVDAKVLDMGPIVGATLGCEFSGDVARVGSLVENKRVVVGAAVFGCVYGNHPGQPDNGAFAEFVAVAGDLVYLLPRHMTYQEGATLGVSLPTVGMSTYYPWKFPPPPLPLSSSTPDTDADADAQYVLVYGGSTAMGAAALQLLRMSGLLPVCTCSPHNFAMVKALGAVEAFDYHEPTCGDSIREYTAGTLAYALDCITDLASMRICYTALGGGGGRYMGLDPLPLRAHTRRDVKPEWTLTFTMFNKPLDLGRPFSRPARPKDRAFAKGWFGATQPLIDTPGRVRPHPLDLSSGGLQDVIKGLDRMRRGDVSGVKLVYSLM
ncbi:trans-L-3-hydroxyproline dehydratase [Colletotrichum spaethianum]|uniref:Trans-L-3-hydroxyproline dehydratase n=1 Tax=Colletotrichum spaethianum TaxID=700344 RepID=A0AA37UTF2_9PEZI|nr:trans-L-3-hydroxyproline dehydratase [Colletotrichum spaethianum]GKT51798.1 trans-L-3-hydroxyproline dehydratase [Colletotrichum spaethianum]